MGKNYTTSIGLDAACLITVALTFDFYSKDTDNILYNVPVTGLTGVTSVYRNIGKMKNTDMKSH